MSDQTTTDDRRAARTTVCAAGDCDLDRAWDLLSLPACWPAWAPHMRHIRGQVIGSAPARVAVGQVLRIDAGVGPLVRVQVTEVTDPGADADAPRSWTLQTTVPVLGRVTSAHEVVRTEDGGCRVEVTITASEGGLAARAALLAYRPLAQVAVGRLVALAAGEGRGAAIAAIRMCNG